jgi:hypothetical protein
MRVRVKLPVLGFKPVKVSAVVLSLAAIVIVENGPTSKFAEDIAPVPSKLLAAIGVMMSDDSALPGKLAKFSAVYEFKKLSLASLTMIAKINQLLLTIHHCRCSVLVIDYL